MKAWLIYAMMIYLTPSMVVLAYLLWAQPTVGGKR